jgi:hypothetical protein
VGGERADFHGQQSMDDQFLRQPYTWRQFLFRTAKSSWLGTSI